MANIPDFPTNQAKNYSSANQVPEKKSNRPKMEPVVTGGVHVKKRTAKTILKAIFVPQDVEKVCDYIVFDVVIPKCKNVVFDLGNSILSAIIYGDSGPVHSTPFGQGSGVQRVSYSSYSSNNSNGQTNYQRIGRVGAARNEQMNRAIFEDVIFDSKVDADMVLQKLNEAIAAYGVVSVNDAYDTCDLTAPYTYNNYGWTSLNSAYVDRNRRGEWIIHFPLALPID